MDSNLSYFSLPFVDVQDLDFGKIRGQDCEYEDLHPTLPHGSLLGADDDVLAQFLSGDDPLEEPDLNGPTTLHCEICRKHFDNAKKYYGHLRVHSKDNLWKCDKCPDEKFSTKQQLMKHSLTHKPLERVWRCPQCEMSFEALWRLQQHLFAKHLDYRPHKCEVCSKTFHKLSDLDKHKDVHAAVKKHACTVCQRKFTDKSNLKRHMLIHGDEKAYPCVGCGHHYKQIASLRKHSKKCPMVQKNSAEPKKTYRNNYCRVCGMTFKYKSSLLEHCVREHSNNSSGPPPEPPKEDKSNQLHVDTNRTVDKIVDDILSAEDDYMTMSTQNDLINYPEVSQLNQDNLMQIELLKEMNQMHNMHVNDIYDDELLYNDIDIDSFQTMCNNIDYERNDLFDLNDARGIDHIMNGKSLNQDLMNAFVRGMDQAKDDIPKEYLNPIEINAKVNEFLNPPVSVNDCSTIFESDVDLEASTNLAANLNQLIGENSVQYISTEHDDTFIISLNSEIDAEQLTDMLNIGVENKPEDYTKQPEVVNKELHKQEVNKEEEVVKITEKKGRVKTKYVCLKCKKVFNKRDNYISHRGTHDTNVKQFACEICSERFSYRSSLNKHSRRVHAPSVKTPHTCFLCNKNFETAYQLKKHNVLNHKLVHPYQCDVKDCQKKCFSKWDLDIHKKSHSKEKPYPCDICGKSFKTRSHLARHVKMVDCTKKFDKPKLVLSTRPERLKKATNDRPIINLYVCDDFNTDKKETVAKRPKIKANQDKPASNLLLLPLKLVKKKTKKLRKAKKRNPKSLLKAPEDLNVDEMVSNLENNDYKKINTDHCEMQLRKLNEKEGAALVEPVNSKVEMNVQNACLERIETNKIEILKGKRLQNVLNTKIPIIAEPLNSKKEINDNGNVKIIEMNEINKFKDEILQRNLKIIKPILAESKIETKVTKNLENVQHSESSETNKIKIITDELLPKVLYIKRPIIAEPLNSKIEVNVNRYVHNLERNKTKQIDIHKDETLRMMQKKKELVLTEPLNSKIKETKPLVANGVILTKPLKRKTEQNNLQTDKIQIKASNGAFIIEPILQLKQNRSETSKIDEVLSKPQASILIEPLNASLKQNNFNTLNTEVIKLQTPKDGSVIIKALASKKENTTERTFLQCHNFRMKRKNLKSLNVEQSKAKSLFVTNKLNKPESNETTNLKIKLITPLPISEENKVKTPNGNLVLTSNSKITSKGNGLKMASFLRPKLKIQSVAEKS